MYKFSLHPSLTSNRNLDLIKYPPCLLETITYTLLPFLLYNAFWYSEGQLIAIFISHHKILFARSLSSYNNCDRLFPLIAQLISTI